MEISIGASGFARPRVTGRRAAARPAARTAAVGARGPDRGATSGRPARRLPRSLADRAQSCRDSAAAVAGSPSPARAARFLALIGAHTPTLEAAARKRCHEPAIVADLVQDTLERAWRRFDSLQDEARARGWLLQILRNAWIDHVRRCRTEISIDEDHEPPVAAPDEPSWWEQITVEDLRRAIAQLPEPFHSVAVLHDLHGHSYREVARLLDIPRATAATRLHRAHVRIRALLQRELDEAERA